MNNKLLVTGSEGFIGRNLVQKLKELDEFRLETFDIADGDVTVSDFQDGISHIIHLAARTYIPASWDDPASFYLTNVQGTVNVLDYCRKNNAKLTYVSAYVYGKPRSLPISEDHPLSPLNPYMHSKVMAEEACRFFSENYNVNVIILRPFNIMGGGQRDDFLIPHIVKQLLDPSVPEIRVNDLSPKRDYLHINDLADAIVSSLGSGVPDVYNVGSGESYSVDEIISLLMELSGIEKPVKSEDQARQNEVMDVRADISKISGKLGWEPGISFRKGLEMIINEYRENEL